MSHKKIEVKQDSADLERVSDYKPLGEGEDHLDHPENSYSSLKHPSSPSSTLNFSPLNDKKRGVFDHSSPLNLAQIQDEEFVRVWLSNQKSPNTIRSYKRVASELLAHLHPKTLQDACLSDLQLFLSQGKLQSDETKRHRSQVIKALFSFAQKTEYIKSNPSILLPKVSPQNKLSERYLGEEEVMRMITLTQCLRDKAILKLLYGSGIRASEFCSLKWKHIQPREAGSAQLQIEGKGGKLRNVVISASTYQDILAQKSQESEASEFVFLSQKGQGISYRRLHEIVDQARIRAGITKKVSPHWLRHAHASHALDRGAPIHLVQATLGHSSIATTGRYLHARPTESSGRYLGV